MKRWLPRSLWLVAWSFWAWLGWGLYRELPRQMGPLICRVPVQAIEAPLGFVKDRPLVVIQPRLPNRNTTFKVFDATSGVFVHDINFDRHSPHSRTHLCRSHGVLLAQGEGTKNAGFYVVNLATGLWKTLSEKYVPDFDIDVHPTRPWVAFRESAAPIDKPRPLVVLDWTTGAEVFVRPQRQGGIRTPVFMGDSNRLVVAVSGSDTSATERTDLEVWLLGSPSRLEKVIRNCGLGAWRKAPSHGRIARCNMDDLRWNLDVVDIDAERVVFSTPPKDRLRTKPGNYLLGPPVGSFQLSKSGKSLTCDPLTCIWDVDAGAERWRPQTGWTLRPAEGFDLFSVEERWDQFLPLMGLARWRTMAVRDLDSPALQFRCWSNDSAALADISADSRLSVGQDGAIRRFPFQINWSLLALCQTVLALPLIILWMMLHRRRKRVALQVAPI